MNSKISYRVPDFKSIWSNSFSAIGFVRLAIIDLSTNSNQLFFSQDKKISIIYNGEIYNYKEIKKFYEKFLKAKKHINSFFLFQIVNTLLWQKNILKIVK